MDSMKWAEMLAALVAERDEFVAQANQRIAYMNGKIELLRELTAAPDEPAAPAPDEANEG